MAETPTAADIITARASISDYLLEGVSLDDFIAIALADVKRYMRNIRGIEWIQVSDGTDYYPDASGDANNDDQLKKAITLTAISLVYKEYSQTVNESQWWDLYLAYKDEAETLLQTAKLDVDQNKDGVINADEEQTKTQTFMAR